MNPFGNQPYIILATRDDGTQYVVPAWGDSLSGARQAAMDLLIRPADPGNPLVSTEVAHNPFANRESVLAKYEPALVRQVA